MGTYRGLFRAAIKAPDRADLEVIERTRASGYKGHLDEAVNGFVVCANPYSDTCVRVYVPRDDRLKPGWEHPSVDVGKLMEHQLVSVTGAVATNAKGENILLADGVTVEPP